jgi:hypothetical protein
MVKKEFKKNKKPKISESIKPESTINQKPLLSFKYYTK